MFRTKLLGAAVAAAALAAPAVASADSIVYIKDGNVWSAKPDGSRKVQITEGGNWHSPTQADDGRIAAVQGVAPIVVMAPDGRPLHTIDTPNAPTSNGGTFAGAPKQLAFTPDGSRIAYTYIQGACPVASSCGDVKYSTFYTDNRPGAATPHDVWGNQFGVNSPEWITNDRALVHGGFLSEVNIDVLGGGDYSFVNWVHPDEDDMGDGELSRDMKKLVTTRSYGKDKFLQVLGVTGDPRTQTKPPAPTAWCDLMPRDMYYDDPSWSPDSSALAFGSQHGVEVLPFKKLGFQQCEGDSYVLDQGATSPDWGPADPPAVAWRPPAKQPETPAPAPQPAPAPPVVTPRPTVAIKAGGAARQKLRGGAFTVTCTAPAGGRCTATATVKVGKRTFRATAATTVKKGAAGKLSLKFGRAAQKALRKALRRGPVKAAVKLSFPGSAGASRTVTLTR